MIQALTDPGKRYVGNDEAATYYSSTWRAGCFLEGSRGFNIRNPVYGSGSSHPLLNSRSEHDL